MSTDTAVGVPREISQEYLGGVVRIKAVEHADFTDHRRLSRMMAIRVAALFAVLVLSVGCGGGDSSSPPVSLAGSYTAATFLTSPTGRLEAVLVELRFDVDGQVVSLDESAYLDNQAGLQETTLLQPQGTYALNAGQLSIPGTATSSSFVGNVAADLVSYAGDVAGAAGAGQQHALLDATADVVDTWTGASLATDALAGKVNLTLNFTEQHTLNGTYEFNGTVVDVTGGSFTNDPDGRFQGNLVGNVAGNPVSAVFTGRVNDREMVMIFQDNQTHVVALVLQRS